MAESKDVHSRHYSLCPGVGSLKTALLASSQNDILSRDMNWF
jgi:hypothetical protein